MNRLSNWLLPKLTLGLLLLGAVRCDAGKETTSSSPKTMASSFLKKITSPGALTAGVIAFVIENSRGIGLDQMQTEAILLGASTTTLATCIRLLSANYLDEQRAALHWKSLLSTYGAHVLAMISGSTLRQLFDAYTKNDPRARLALTCIGALLATCVDQEPAA